MENKDIFKDKVLLITGGTGSFGNAVLRRFLKTSIKEIRIFSRDEKKQDDMRHEYQAKYPEEANKLKFYIGDVRDYRSIDDAMDGVDYVFHAAALKQVPSCEFFPVEAVRTNVLGASNVIEAAITHNVKKVIVLSTDKAAYPINAMGMTKALMDKVAVAKGRDLGEGKTVICRTRYGNVMASRGSVIPLFAQQIREGKPLSLFPAEGKQVQIFTKDQVVSGMYDWADQILCATNAKRNQINKIVRSQRGYVGDEPQIGDKVISLHNHWDYLSNRGVWALTNGSIGTLTYFY